MKLDDAKKLAEELLIEIKPYCKEIIVGGSIRRAKSEVKDIEIILVPKNLVEIHNWAINQTKLQWIKPAVSEIIPWHPVLGGKYWRAILLLEDNNHIKVDIFQADEDNFGLISVLRTGPAEFNTALAVILKKWSPVKLEGGNLVRQSSGEVLTCSTEEEFFEKAGVKFVPPENRDSPNPYNSIKWR